MKIYSLFIYSELCTAPQPVYKIYNIDEFNFFQKKSIKEVLLFGSNLVHSAFNLTNVVSANIMSVVYENYQINVKSTANRTYVLITDKDYNNRIIINLFKSLSTIKLGTESESESELKKIISEDYYKTDKLIKTKEQLDETVEIIKKTIDSVIDRGTTLEKLVKDSEDLGISSKIFYKQSKDSNRCCLIM